MNCTNSLYSPSFARLPPTIRFIDSGFGNPHPSATVSRRPLIRESRVDASFVSAKVSSLRYQPKLKENQMKEILTKSNTRYLLLLINTDQCFVLLQQTETQLQSNVGHSFLIKNGNIESLTRIKFIL